jgi:hypothetical protein
VPVPGQYDSWIRYLSVVTSGMIAFGAVLVLLPGVTEAGFGAMVYGRSGFPAAFTAPTLDYVRLAHAVLGAVMVGWFCLVRWVIRGPLAQGVPGAWAALVGSVVAWYLPDTAFSALNGFWENAILNTVVLLAFLPGLVRTRSRPHPFAPLDEHGLHEAR